MLLDGTPWDRPIEKAEKSHRTLNVLFGGGPAPIGAMAVDLTRWQHSASAQSIVILKERLRALLAAQRARKRWRIGLATLPSAAIIFGLIADLLSASSTICVLEPIRSGCSYAGFGGVATAAEERRYQKAVDSGCNGLRHFVRTQPDNPRVADARRLIDAAQSITTSRWDPAERRLPMFVSGPPARTEPVAEVAAHTASRETAGDICRSAEVAGVTRLRGNSADVSLSCFSSSDGWRCSGSGVALCSIEELRVTRAEVCR